MPNTFYPNGTIPSQGATHARNNAILSSTNASPIVVTTTVNGTTPGPHGFATGDNVEIVGHTTNTAANGVWQITVLTANTFSLNGSTGNGVGVGHGNVTTVTVDPAFTLPSDGDEGDASSVTPALEGTANAIPWLYSRVGRYRLVDQYSATNYATGYPGATWGLSGPDGPTIDFFNTPQDISGNIFQGGYPGYLNPPGLLFGDLLDIQISTEVKVLSVTPYVFPTLAYQACIVVDTQGGAIELVTGSETTLTPVANASPAYLTSSTIWSVTMRSIWTPPSPYLFSSFGVRVAGILQWHAGGGPTGGGDHMAVSGIYGAIVNHYRLNSVNQ